MPKPKKRSNKTATSPINEHSANAHVNQRNARPLIPFFLPGSVHENTELLIPSPLQSPAQGRKSGSNSAEHDRSRWATSSVYLSPSPESIPLPNFVTTNNVLPRRLEFNRRDQVHNTDGDVEDFVVKEVSHFLLQTMLK
uniref:Uncharacterized protein n=1 Tax=Spongospora subterranea TaxID=70186 RepID=A0A0H5RBU7_9EUKA|eukprot:CRZ11246.1 hypothetical protein [Spongospora subterranea]